MTLGLTFHRREIRTNCLELWKRINSILIRIYEVIVTFTYCLVSKKRTAQPWAQVPGRQSSRESYLNTMSNSCTKNISEHQPFVGKSPYVWVKYKRTDMVICARHIGQTVTIPHSAQQHTCPHGRNATDGTASRQMQHSDSPVMWTLPRELWRCRAGASGAGGALGAGSEVASSSRGAEGALFQASGSTCGSVENV